MDVLVVWSWTRGWTKSAGARKLSIPNVDRVMLFKLIEISMKRRRRGVAQVVVVRTEEIWKWDWFIEFVRWLKIWEESDFLR